MIHESTNTIYNPQKPLETSGHQNSSQVTSAASIRPLQFGRSLISLVQFFWVFWKGSVVAMSPQVRLLHRQYFQSAKKSVLLASDRGSVTAEYVIATLAAVSFAGLLVFIMRSDEVRTVLTDMVRNALQFPG